MRRPGHGRLQAAKGRRKRKEDARRAKGLDERTNKKRHEQHPHHPRIPMGDPMVVPRGKPYDLGKGEEVPDQTHP